MVKMSGLPISSREIEAIHAVLFDFDGTLTSPGSLDFPALKRELGCSENQPVLEFIASLKSAKKRREALHILERFESDAAKISRPNAGAEESIRDLRARNLPIGIISRNRLKTIRETLRHFTKVSVSDFKAIISRDDRVAAKPDPAGMLLAARKMGVRVENLLVVGDFRFDIEAGQKAGAPTVFLTNGGPLPRLSHPPNFVITHLAELKTIVDYFRPLPVGKLPGHLLAQFLEENPLDDPSIVIGPALGEDVAVVKLGDGDRLVLKSDPITFTTDELARYAVLVSANDVATSGGRPRWLLTTLLFPAGSSAAQIHRLMQDLQHVSHQLGITLCGGHTELTEAVNQPVVIGQIVGTVRPDQLIDKRRMKKGDQVLLSKPVAVEGTAIIGRKFSAELRALGMSEREINRCRRFLTDPGISILREAGIAAQSGYVSAMHDVTEGGIATALEELSAAGGHRLRIYLDRIPVFRETRHLCRLLGLSPLGLIASGSLLIACRPKGCEELLERLQAAGIPACRIGEVLEEGTGIKATGRKGRPVEWPRFSRDEIARAMTALSTLA